jgi:hypothetical protein
MTSFIVDPLLITTPYADTAPEEARAWLLNISTWVTEIQSSPFEWRHVYESTIRLLGANAFPTFSLLRDLAARSGADVNISAISSGVAKFFQDPSRDLYSSLTTQCAVVNNAQSAINPGAFIQRNIPSVRESLADAMLCLACDKCVGGPFATGARVVTTRLPAGENIIIVSCDIGLTDPPEVYERIVDRRVEQSIEIVVTPDQLFDAVGIVSYLASADGLSMAIQREARRIQTQPLMLLAMGPAFWQSLRDNGISNDFSAMSKLVRVSGAILCGLAKDLNIDLREVRQAETADSRPLMRESDGAKAYRATLVKYGIGWRLHYWHVPGRASGGSDTIELSLVLRKGDPVRMV